MRNRRAAVSDTSAPTLVSRSRRSGERASGARARHNAALGAVGVCIGTTAGVMLALGSGPTERVAASARTASPASSTVTAGASSPSPTSPASATPASAAPASAAPGPRELQAGRQQAALVVQIKDVLARFVAWASEHPRAGCPDAAALGIADLDPWGHPLRIVCADQPADQIAGVLSLGPDGLPGTRDDVVSWTLGAEVTDLARGPRWSTRRAPTSLRVKRRLIDPRRDAAPVAATQGAPRDRSPSPPATQPPAGAPPTGAGSGAVDLDSEGIPNRR